MQKAVHLWILLANFIHFWDQSGVGESHSTNHKVSWSYIFRNTFIYIGVLWSPPVDLLLSIRLVLARFRKSRFSLLFGYWKSVKKMRIENSIIFFTMVLGFLLVNEVKLTEQVSIH